MQTRGPHVRFDKAAVTNAALRLVQEHGFEAISAQTVAQELGCSVHPIYRVFDSMEGLKDALVQTAWSLFDERLVAALSKPDNGFLSMGLELIEFAKEEPNLFKLMFMTNVIGDITLQHFVTGAFENRETIEAIRLETGISEKHAREMFAACYFQAHGIAALCATNTCRFTDDEIQGLLFNTGRALIGTFRQEEENEKGDI